FAKVIEYEWSCRQAKWEPKVGIYLAIHSNRSSQWSYRLTGIFRKASFRSRFCSTANLPCLAMSAIASSRVWYESDLNSEGIPSLTDSFGGCDRSWIRRQLSNCP